MNPPRPFPSSGRAPRIALSCGRLAVGGPETHLNFLCQLLREHGAAVDIYGTGCDWSPATVTTLRARGVRFWIPPAFLRKFRRLATLWAIALWLPGALRRCDHLLIVGAGRSHGFLQKLLRPRGHTVYHELVMPPHIDTESSLAAACIRCADVLVASSEPIARSMEPLARGRDLQVIPFLTTMRRIAPPAPRSGASDRTLRIGYVGRLDVRKRPHLLLHHWRELSRLPHVAPATLHIHGGDQGSGMTDELRAWVCDHHADEEIVLHGAYSHEDLRRLLTELDIVVLPSEWEGLPLVLVEAMQHGVPFVATCAGGTAELGRDNPDVVVTPLDWDSFAQGVSTLAGLIRGQKIDPVRLHHYAERHYGCQSVGPRWLRLFGIES